MTKEQRLTLAFKRLIHVLTTGKRTPQVFGNTALYMAEVHVLETIGRNPGITATEIVNNMRVTKGAISQIVSKLHRKGLIQRSSRSEDMKIQELFLTDKGTEIFVLHDEYEREFMQQIGAELKKCTAEDIRRFTSMINMIADVVKK